MANLYFEAAQIFLLTSILMVLLLDEDHVTALRRCCSRILFSKILPKCPEEEEQTPGESEPQTSNNLGPGPWDVWVTDEGTWDTVPPKIFAAEIRTRCALKQAVLEASKKSLEGEIHCHSTQRRQRFGRNIA
jgi:hypothetical protein